MKAAAKLIDGEFSRLLRVCNALDHNRLTAKDKKWLRLLLGGIVRGEDVRDQFFTKRRRGEHADKRTAEINARDFACALYIANRSTPDRADKITVAQAKFDAESEFKMTDGQVRLAWMKQAANAREFLKQLHKFSEAEFIEIARKFPGSVEVREIPDLVHSSDKK